MATYAEIRAALSKEETVKKELLRLLTLAIVLAIVISLIDHAIGAGLTDVHVAARALHYIMYMAFGAFVPSTFRRLRSRPSSVQAVMPEQDSPVITTAAE